MSQAAILKAARYAESLSGAHTVHVQGDLGGGLVVDVAEFLQDWGPGRAHGVHDWLQEVPGEVARVHVMALRPTGVRRGADEEYETTAESTF